jgi:hypothetical protein
MAPKRSQKVLAAVHESVPRPGHKRAKIEDPVEDKVAAIAEALSDPQVEIQGTSACREMFLATMPHALKTPRSERHNFQAEVASMIGDILNSSKDSWTKKVQDAQEAVDSTGAERTTAASARDEANDKLKEQQAELTSRKEQDQQCADAEKAAKQLLEAAEKEVRDFEDVKLAKIKTLEEREAIYKKNFEALKSPEAPLSAADQKIHLSPLSSLCRELKADTSLVVAMQAGLKKMPADRGDFDGMAIENVGTLLKENIASLQSDLDNSDSIKAQKNEAQAQAQAAYESAKENHAASTDAVRSASEIFMTKHSESKLALKNMVSKGLEADNAIKFHAEQQKGFDKASKLVSMFTFLVERDVMPEPEPQSLVEEKVMMEESPAVAEPQAMQVA